MGRRTNHQTNDWPLLPVVALVAPALACVDIAGLNDITFFTAAAGGTGVGGGTATGTSGTGGGGATASAGGGGGGTASGGGECTTVRVGDNSLDEIEDATSDTTLHQGCPDTALGLQDSLEVEGEEVGSGGAGPGCDENKEKRALLRFDLSSLPSGAELTKVTLHIWTSSLDGSGSGDTLSIGEVKEAWSENEATWNDRMTGSAWSQPGCGGACSGGAPLATFQPDVEDHEWTIPLAPASVQHWVTAPQGNHGLIIFPGGTNSAVFCSTQHQDTKRPSLEVAYCLP